MEAASRADVRDAAGAQIAPNPRWPLELFLADLQAIQGQLLDGERVLAVRTLHQGTVRRKTGAIAVTTHRLLVADLSSLPNPVAETVLFSEVNDVAARRRGLGGYELTVRTSNGRRYRGLESKDGVSAKRFVATLQAQIDAPSALHLRELPSGSVAAAPPTAFARVQALLGVVQVIFTALLPIAALLFLTGVVPRTVSVAVFAVFAFSRAMGKLTGYLDMRARAARNNA